MENHHYAIVYSDSLSHHGILGQKWGKRNGPPYPLDAGDHSAREKKAGWRASLKKGSNQKKTSRIKNASENFKRRLAEKAVKSQTIGYAKKNVDSAKSKWDSLDERQKKLIKAGLVVAGTALVAYGAYRIYRSNNAINFIKPTEEAFKNQTLEDSINSLGIFKHIPGIKDSVKEQLDNLNENYQKDAILKITDPSQLKHWESAPSIDDIKQKVNPELSQLLKDKPFDKMSYMEKLDVLEKCPSEYTTNCMYCTTAYDLNRRGFKVKANGRTQGGTLEQIPKMYKLKDDAMVFDTKYGNVNKYLEKFSKMDNGSRGNMIVAWKGGGGHSMAWEVVDNKLNVIDCQSGERYSTEKEIKRLISKTKGTIKTVRTDNADIIWSDMMLRSLEQMK